MINDIFQCFCKQFKTFGDIQGGQHLSRSIQFSSKEERKTEEPQHPGAASGSFSLILPICKVSTKCNSEPPADTPDWQGETG